MFHQFSEKKILLQISYIQARNSSYIFVFKVLKNMHELH